MTDTLLSQAMTHLRQGRLAEAERGLRAVLAADPGEPRALHQLGLLARRAGQAEAARQLLERAAMVPTVAAEALADLGTLRQEAGDLPGAVAAYEKALAARPGWLPPRANLAAALLKLGRYQAALDALEPLLAAQPQHAHALAYKALALWELGRDAEARALVGLERLIFRRSLPAPPGWPGRAAFDQALATEIAEHPSITRAADPTRRAVRSGAVTGDLFADVAGPAVAAFRAALEQEIRTWLATLPEDASHPWLARKPVAWRLVAWGNLLAGPGHQAPHIHNLGWLSGVYYVAVPPEVRPDDPRQGGWIVFGRPGYGLPTRRAPETRALPPVAGQLCLFPSSLWHETQPFAGVGTRISLAFDLIPAA